MAKNNALKPSKMGKGDIAKLNNNQSADDILVAKAYRATNIAVELNTSRCTTPQEMQDRFIKLFENCAKERYYSSY